MSKPLVGISSCLVGYQVRYDGKAKLNQLILENIAPFVTLQPICPEAAVGLGIPRPPVQLIKTQNAMLALGRDDDRIDVTDALTHFGKTLTKVHSNLCGYIFQSRSPSCGVGTTPIFDENKQPIGLGNGLVADKLLKHFPELPIINETDIANKTDADNFIKKVTRIFESRQ